MAVEIRSTRNGSTLSISDPRSGAEGFVTYTTELKALPLSAVVEVEDFGLDGLVGYFSEIARQWRGWKGAMTYESVEGQLRFESTSDTSGHVFLKVSLRDDLGGADWLASGVFFLEAGQLQQLATDMQRLAERVRNVS